MRRSDHDLSWLYEDNLPRVTAVGCRSPEHLPRSGLLYSPTASEDLTSGAVGHQATESSGNWADDFRRFLESEPPISEWVVIVDKQKRKTDYDL